MIGIVIPAHNEQHGLRDCLASIQLAAGHPDLQGEDVAILVVLDACTDASAMIAASLGVATLTIGARNVGRARAAGADHQLAAGARWLAFTDADTVVSPDWLVAQLGLRAEAVCGTVSVGDWSPHGAQLERVRRHFAEHYLDADGHRHIHGANMGVSAHAYRRAGGFPPLALSEDVALVEALLAVGVDIAWSALPRVTTSARLDARAAGGFGDTLRGYAAGAQSGVVQLLPG
ncbi:glycosyltransferase [Robbsia sp. Bb-Pol-6]|uniref:Glycosyltransferase n=1 Tax=Robbsia betulipollinis TaxID=2981849 RepID=A0ABT3ZLH5_9BURK|nr:glycosyltransferase [Robbsia betulipollinis]MCY0387385.1 glycosyltransferase [Robbsia betulipollinis]